jgi:MFS family permease
MERNIKLLGLFNFFTDFKFHSAILVIYFARVTGSYTLAMSLFSVAMLSSAFFEVPTGIFSDMIGRKKTVLSGAIAAAEAAVFYAIGHSYWPLFVGALLDGLSQSWYSGNNDALLHDSLLQVGRKTDYAHYLGKTSAMFQAALMVGAVVGSILATWSFSLIMWLSVVPQILCFFIALFIREPAVITRGQSNIFSHISISALHLWNNKKLKLLSIQDILNFGISESAFNFSAAFIGSVWPLWAIGFSKMISFAAAFVSFWSSGKYIRKIGGINILIITNIYSRIISFIAYGIPTVFSPVLMGSTSIFYGVSQVSKNALMQKEYTQEQRATLGSLNSFLGSIFYGIFSPILGYIADIYGPAKALIMVQFCMLSVLYISFKLKKMERANI